MNWYKHIKKEVSGNQSKVILDQAIYSGTTRLLAPQLFGVFSSIVIGIYLLISISNALVIQPFQIRISVVDDPKRYTNFTFLLQLGLITLFTLVVLVTAQIMGSMKTDFWTSARTYFHPFALILYGTSWLLHDYFRKLFLATDQIKKTIVIDGIVAVIQIAGLVGLGVTHHVSLNAAISVLGIGYALGFVVALMQSSVGFSILSFQSHHLSYHRKQGGFLFLSSMLQWWSSNLFVITSGLILGVASLGAFRLVQSSFGVLNLVLQTFENYILPKAARLRKISEKISKKYLHSISKKGALIFGCILVPMFLFSKTTMWVLGGMEYLSFHYVIRGMVILYVVIYLGYSVRIPIRILGLNRSFFKGYGLTFLLSLVSYQFLLERFGISGAIFGLIVNQLVLIIYWHRTLKQNQYHIWT